MDGKNRENNGPSYVQYNTVIEPEGYVKLWVFIVLYVITFGIYMWFWVYKTVGLFNKKTGSNDGQVQQLLLCAFVPFYTLYWLYKYTNMFSKYGASVGYVAKSNLTTTCMILALSPWITTFVGLLLFYSPVGWLFIIAGYVCATAAYAVFQNAINNCLLCELNNGKVPVDSVNYIEKPSMSAAKTEQIYEESKIQQDPVNITAKQPVDDTSVLIKSTRNVTTKNSDADVVNQLRELKTLYDEGILTEEEFDYKKRELLK